MTHTPASLKQLLDTYNPGASVPKLGAHNAAFAAALAIVSNDTDNKALPSLEQLRQSVTSSLDGKHLTYPAGMSQQSYKEEEIGGLRCYTLKTKTPETAPTFVMFYGGGFCLDTLAAHKAFMANVAARTACNIILPDCPLAPEIKAPEIIAKTGNFLKELLANPLRHGFSENVILMGWSSGSNLALTLALNLQTQAPNLYSKISKFILLSPWIDLSLQVSRTGPFQTQQNADTIAAGADLLELMSKWYLPAGSQGTEAEFCPACRSPEALAKLAPVTIITGACEVLFGDAVFLADALKRAGTETQLIAVEGQTHNYLVFNELSLDGVYIPELIARIAHNQAVENMRGTDNLGLIVKKSSMGMEK